MNVLCQMMLTNVNNTNLTIVSEDEQSDYVNELLTKLKFILNLREWE